MPDSGRPPLEPTPSRLKWLDSVFRREVEAARVDVDNVGGQRWLPCGDGRRADWLTNPLVDPMWSVSVDPTDGRHRVILTLEGLRLRDDFSKLLQPKKGPR